MPTHSAPIAPGNYAPSPLWIVRRAGNYTSRTGTWVDTHDGDGIGAYVVENSSTAINDDFTFNFWLPEVAGSRRWVAVQYYIRDTDGGRWKNKINGTYRNEIDSYAAAKESIGGAFNVAGTFVNGLNTWEVDVYTKNASSSDYIARLGPIVFYVYAP